jgi:hypothetical protein
VVGVYICIVIEEVHWLIEFVRGDLIDAVLDIEFHIDVFADILELQEEIDDLLSGCLDRAYVLDAFETLRLADQQKDTQKTEQDLDY